MFVLTKMLFAEIHFVLVVFIMIIDHSVANFINVLRTAFTHVDPKKRKKYSQVVNSFKNNGT